jgi:hypothetical protein
MDLTILDIEVSTHLWLSLLRLKHSFWSNCDATIKLFFSMCIISPTISEIY